MVYKCGPSSAFDVNGDESLMMDELSFVCDDDIGSVSGTDWNGANLVPACKCMHDHLSLTYSIYMYSQSQF